MQHRFRHIHSTWRQFLRSAPSLLLSSLIMHWGLLPQYTSAWQSQIAFLSKQWEISSPFSVLSNYINADSTQHFTLDHMRWNYRVSNLAKPPNSIWMRFHWNRTMAKDLHALRKQRNTLQRTSKKYWVEYNFWLCAGHSFSLAGMMVQRDHYCPASKRSITYVARALTTRF